MLSFNFFYLYNFGKLRLNSFGLNFCRRRKMKKYLLLLGLIFMVSSCQNNVKPELVPGVEVKKTSTPLEVIGGVEPVYFLPMQVPFAARIDTGAETSSIDVANLHQFERDGEKWVSFDLKHDENGEKHHFEKKVARKVNITRINKDEKRLVVNMDIKIGNNLINAEFSLANREKFTYQALIGRNVLNGRFMVDPSIENTLH